MARNNHVEIIGNMGDEARINEANGKPMAAVSIATTDSYKDKEDQWQDKETLWHNVLVFNPKFIEVVKNLKKGTRLKVTGELSYREFKTVTEDGQEVTKKECSIIAKNVEQAPLPAKRD